MRCGEIGKEHMIREPISIFFIFVILAVLLVLAVPVLLAGAVMDWCGATYEEE